MTNYQLSRILRNAHFLASWLFVMKTALLIIVQDDSIQSNLVKKKSWWFSLWIYILTLTTNNNIFSPRFKILKTCFYFLNWNQVFCFIFKMRYFSKHSSCKLLMRSREHIVSLVEGSRQNLFRKIAILEIYIIIESCLKSRP